MRAGEAARAAAWGAAVALVARHTVGTWQLARTLTWLRYHEQADKKPADRCPRPEVHVIIPVLREQQHVSAALAWWRPILPMFPGMSLTIVSTDREEHERDLLAIAVCGSRHITQGDFPQLSSREVADLNRARAEAAGPLAPDIAAAILARTPLTRDVVTQLLTGDDPAQIRHLTYPGFGRKAAQINYAADTLPADGYIAVYDVDSRPDPELLTATYALLTSALHESPPVVQQHALHAASQVTRPGIQQTFVRGSATLQTIWTLRREVPYARRYHQSASRAGRVARVRAGLAQPVGHGLFLRQDVVAELGGLPEITVLDDVPTGVPLTLRGIPSISLPKVAAVPAPESLAEVIAQGRRWFCSYLDYPTVLRAAARTGTGSPGRRNLAYAVAAYRGGAWLAASPVTAVGVAAVLSPRSGHLLRATALTGVLLASVVPVAMTAAEGHRPRSAPGIGRDSAELLAAYLLRSLGPWLAVADAACGRHPNSSARPAPKAHRHQGAAP